MKELKNLECPFHLQLIKQRGFRANRTFPTKL